MRALNSHIVNPCNDKIVIEVMDEPGAGGANHAYALSVADTDHALCTLNFQNGPIAEVGTNGVTHEALLAVVEDRLLSFQKGPYACRENAVALTKIQEATMWLQRRTMERMRRGVEGTHKV